MNIVDAQIHMGPGGIDNVLAAMDALGIRAALIDEYWVRSFANEPHHPLPGGGYRPLGPTAELAAQLHPERFSWLLRIHRLDPEYVSIARQVRDAPSGRALRIDPGLSPDEMRRFAAGGYDHICAAAAEAGLPLFVFAPDNPRAFARCAREFPGLRIIIDHCGLFSNSMRATVGGGAPPKDETQQLELFDAVLALSEFPNIGLKWGNASAMFDTPAWPGHGLEAVLRRAISAFGAERIMWASDYSVNQRGESWGELLFGMRANGDLTEHERAWIMGGSVRHWLAWPE
jgi:L-fuconolactonase